MHYWSLGACAFKFSVKPHIRCKSLQSINLWDVYAAAYIDICFIVTILDSLKVLLIDFAWFRRDPKCRRQI